LSWLKARFRHLADQGAVGAFGGEVDGGVQVFLGILDDDGLAVIEADLDLAALVAPATRTVDVRQPDASRRVSAQPSAVCRRRCT
jgi:hypothetical protein